MLYLVKIISAWLLPPGIFILLLLVLHWFVKTKRLAKFCLRMSAFVVATMYLLSLPPIAGYLLRPLENAYTPSELNKAEAIIILGGGATGGSSDISGLGNVSGFGANRLLTGAQLYRKQPLPIILTGGKVYADSGNEAQIGQRILLNLGVPAKDIFLDPKARNTMENAHYTIRICQERGYKAVYLVTSAFHMPRSLLNFTPLFTQAGIKVYPYPCDYMINANSTWTVFSFIPQVDAFALSSLALHEYLGILAKKVF